MLKKKNSSYSLSDKKIRSYPLSKSNSISLNKKVNNSLPTDLSLSIKTPNNNFRTDNYYVDLSQHMKDLKIIKKELAEHAVKLEKDNSEYYKNNKEEIINLLVDFDFELFKGNESKDSLFKSYSKEQLFYPTSLKKIKDISKFVKENGSNINIIHPYSGYLVKSISRSPEDIKKSIDILSRYQENVLNAVWIKYFQNFNNYKFTFKGKQVILRKYTSIQCNLNVLELIAKQEDSLIVKCEIENVKILEGNNNNLIIPGQKVCCKVSPYKISSFQIFTEKRILNKLWDEYVKIYPEHNNIKYPFPRILMSEVTKDDTDFMITNLFWKDLNYVFRDTKFINNEMRWDKVLELMDQLINILDILHCCGFIHRDVKPENVMFKSEDLKDIVLMDFGLANELDKKNNDKVENYTQEGTPNCADIRQHESGNSRYNCAYDLQAIAWSILWLMEDDKGPICKTISTEHYNKDGSIWDPARYNAKKRFLNEPIEVKDPIINNAYKIARKLIKYTLTIDSTSYDKEYYIKCRNILHNKKYSSKK